MPALSESKPKPAFTLAVAFKLAFKFLLGCVLGNLTYLAFDTLIHEMGHAAAFYAMGIKIAEIKIGDGPEWFRIMLGQVPLVINTDLSGNGHVLAYTYDDITSVIALLAGPLAPLVLGVIVLLVTWRLNAPQWIRLWIIIALMLSAGSARDNLMPQNFITDGGQLWILLTLLNHADLYQMAIHQIRYVYIGYGSISALCILYFILYPNL